VVGVNTIVMTIILFLILAIVLIVGVLVAIQKREEKGIKKQLANLEIEKNKIDSMPIVPELTKIESLNKNGNLETMYNKWKDRLDVIRTNQIPKITDMLLDADYSLSKQDYKSTIYKIAKLEMEIYKVRTNSDFLLNEIKEITTSEERNRAIITNLKSLYRDLYEEYTNNKTSYGDVTDAINLQFENIAKKFETFEVAMENNEFTEIHDIVKSIDDLLKHMTNVLKELPSICLMVDSVLPKKISDASSEYNQMVSEGYPLDYLNVEYNINEANEKIRDIKERSKVLNIEDSLFELKVLSDYFDSLFTDFEKEKVNRSVYEDANKTFVKKLKKNNHILEEMFNQLDNIRSLYNLSDEDIKTLEGVREELVTLNEDYKVLIEHTGNNTFAYSKLTKEIEGLSVKLANLEEKIDMILDSIDNMKDDEVRARQQLEEIKVILRDAKNRIREYNLPIIPQHYFVELKEAQSAIKEIIKELDKKPITVSVLNTRVDTARDLVLKLYQSTKNMMKTAKFAEMAIVYGNRYRSDEEDLDKYLTYAEKLFYEGEYQKSLEVTINSLNRVEKGIYDKLLNLYSLEEEK
jgi:septation ring formation regulator